MNGTKASNDAWNGTMRVENSQTTAWRHTGRAGTWCITKHVVKYVYAMERWRWGCTETSWEDSLNPWEEPTSTRIEQKYKRWVDKAMRTLGTHRKALWPRTKTNSENTVGYDPKILVRKKPTEDTGRDQRQIKNTDLQMAMDDLWNNHLTEESQTWRSKWEVLLMVTTRRSTRILLSMAVQKRTKRLNRLAGLSDITRNMPMGSRTTRWLSDGWTSKSKRKNGLARGRQRRPVMGALDENEGRPWTYSLGSRSTVLRGSSSASGELTTHSRWHKNPIWMKYGWRMVQRVVQMACGRNAMSAPKYRNLEEHSPLVQQIAAHKGPKSVDKQNPQQGTQNATARILLSDAV